MEVKTGICQICHKEFKLTKSGKLHRHGYKQEIHHKKWTGYFGNFIVAYYKLIQSSCIGSGLPPIILEKELKNESNFRI